jgi:hypothetical protein
MRKGCAITAMGLVFGAIAMNGLAFAHGMEKHYKETMDEMQMKKLHSMMPMFSEVSAKLETALEKKI